MYPYWLLRLMSKIGATKEANLQQERFFKDYLIVHTHIEKCAGTSLNVEMSNLIGKQHSCDLRNPEIKRPKDMDQAEIEKIRFLTGHFHFRDHMRFFHKKPVYIATVRDPVERFVSFVRYARKGKRHPAHSVSILPPEECLEKLIERKHGVVSNGQCMALSKSRLFQDAQKNILKNYLVVQPFYFVNRISQLFHHFLNNANDDYSQFPTYANKNQENTFELTPLVVNKIKELNSEDDQLFQWVCQYEDELLEQAKRNLTSTLY